MAMVLTDDKHYKAIADMIRYCDGSNTTYKPEEMAPRIDTLTDEMYEYGYNDGMSEYDEWWQNYQHPVITGTPQDGVCDYRFAGRAWNETTFYPQDDMQPTRAVSMFAMTGFKGDLAQRLEDCGVTLDFSKCTMMNGLFTNASLITRVPKIDLTSNTADNASLFINCGSLVTVDEIVFGENTKAYTSMFSGCSKLVNVEFSGIINKNGIDVSKCTGLTVKSLVSLFTVLENKTSDTSSTTWKVTIGATNIAKLTSEQLAIAQNKGWVVA